MDDVHGAVVAWNEALRWIDETLARVEQDRLEAECRAGNRKNGATREAYIEASDLFLSLVSVLEMAHALAKSRLSEADARLAAVREL